MTILDVIHGGGAMQQNRRLLVYLVLDVSGSMEGAPLQAVQEGVAFLIKELQNVPEAVELAHLCVITFGSDARVAVRLQPLRQFQMPELAIAGETNMAGALELVMQELDRDFVPNSGGEVKGDYKPIIFLLTDGEPMVNQRNDLPAAIRAGQALLNRPPGKSVGTFLALGCGRHANANNLKQIARNVAMMIDMTPDHIKDFFQWVSASIGAASRQASHGVGAAGGAAAAPEIPRDANGEQAFKLEF